MFDDLNAQDKLGLDNQDVLAELEQNTEHSLQQQGAHFKVQVKAKFTVQPANISEVHEYKHDGVCAELTDSGLAGLLTVPLQVGDIYRLNFDRGALALPMMFARCVRCRLIQEEAYEIGFEFFTPITLPEGLHQ